MNHDDLPIISFDTPGGLSDLMVGEGVLDPEFDHPLDNERFHIRMANSLGRREAASLLIKKMYGWRGYAVDPGAAHALNKITLFAETGGTTVGTMTLCLDDEAGLPADENFRDKLDT